MTDQEYDMQEITVADAAEAADVPIGTIHYWLRSGQLEGTQGITGRWTVNVGSLRRLIQSLAEKRKNRGKTVAHLEAWLEERYGAKIA